MCRHLLAFEQRSLCGGVLVLLGGVFELARLAPALLESWPCTLVARLQVVELVGAQGLL